MSVIRFQILMLPENNVIYTEDADRDKIIDRMQKAGGPIIHLLSLLQPEYFDEFKIRCSRHGETGDYEMVLTDTETKEVYTERYFNLAKNT